MQEPFGRGADLTLSVSWKSSLWLSLLLEPYYLGSILRPWILGNSQVNGAQEPHKGNPVRTEFQVSARGLLEFPTNAWKGLDPEISRP